MAKLTKKQLNELASILDKLQRGQNYLLSDKVLVCLAKSTATTTLDFRNEKGEACTSVNKEIGSELALLHTGIGDLRRFLSAPT